MSFTFGSLSPRVFEADEENIYDVSHEERIAIESVASSYGVIGYVQAALKEEDENRRSHRRKPRVRLKCLFHFLFHVVIA